MNDSLLFTNTTKINGVCQGFDQRIHNIHREIDVVDVFYEDENVPKT
jgi:predicted CoA-binding protein